MSHDNSLASNVLEVTYEGNFDVNFDTIKWTPVWTTHCDGMIYQKIVAAANQLAKTLQNSNCFEEPELAFNYLMLNTSHFTVNEFLQCLSPTSSALKQILWHMHANAAKQVSQAQIDEKERKVRALEQLLNAKNNELTMANQKLQANAMLDAAISQLPETTTADNPPITVSAPKDSLPIPNMNCDFTGTNPLSRSRNGSQNGSTNWADSTVKGGTNQSQFSQMMQAITLLAQNLQRQQAPPRPPPTPTKQHRSGIKTRPDKYDVTKHSTRRMHRCCELYYFRCSKIFR